MACKLTINPGLIVALAAFVVLAQLGVSWWLYRDLERRLTSRIDELNRLVSALGQALGRAPGAEDGSRGTNPTHAGVPYRRLVSL